MNAKPAILIAAKGFWSMRTLIEQDVFTNKFTLLYNENLETIEEERQYVHAIVVADQKVDASRMDAYPNLKTIARTGTGYDNIDMNAARSRGIVVSRVAKLNAEAVSEFALGLIFALSKNTVRLHEDMLLSKWQRRPGTLFADLTVGIVGLGAIGRSLVMRLHHLGVKQVFGWNRTLRPEVRALVKTSRLVYTGFSRVLRESDVVVVALALTPETRCLIGEEELSLMKSTASLINISRGAVVDENALARFLKEERIGGVALDVFSEEPPDSALFLEPFMESLIESAHAGQNVILTPHNAWMTKDVVELVSLQVARNIMGVLDGDLKDVELVP